MGSRARRNLRGRAPARAENLTFSNLLVQKPGAGVRATPVLTKTYRGPSTFRSLYKKKLRIFRVDEPDYVEKNRAILTPRSRGRASHPAVQLIRARPTREHPSMKGTNPKHFSEQRPDPTKNQSLRASD